MPDNVLRRGRSCSSADADQLDAASGGDRRKDTLIAGLLAVKLDGRLTTDGLGVNESHRGRYRSLVQLTGLHWSYEVGARRRGCCTYPLYRRPALFNFGIIKAA